MQNRINTAFEGYLQALEESSMLAVYSKRQREAALMLAGEWLSFANNNGMFDD